MKILFLLTYPRSTTYLLSAFERLCEQHEVYYFCYRQMSSHERWGNQEVDLRPIVNKRLSESGAICLGEPALPFESVGDQYSSEFAQAIAGHRFDLAIIDENNGKKNWGTNLLYQILKKRGVPVIGCPEGVVNDDEQGFGRLATNLGVSFDYCFCIGQYGLERMTERNPNLRGRIFATGIPDNDRLKDYSDVAANQGEHILVVPSFTTLSGKSHIFEPLTDEVLESCGLYKLADEYNLPIVIKEKGKRHSTECAFDHLRSDSIDVTFNEKNVNELVARSRFIIGAPSTLLLKGLELGIPTAVLSKPYMGRPGVFEFFEGFTDSSEMQVISTLKTQEANGGTTAKFIEDAVRGGTDFSSTDRFIEAVETIGAHGDSYRGPKVFGKRGLGERVWMNFPRAYKEGEYVYHQVKDLAKSVLKRTRVRP